MPDRNDVFAVIAVARLGGHACVEREREGSR
jgi:hypothetical protein